jgi:hypothetical protein
MATPAKTLRMSNKGLRLIRSQINSQESASFVDRDFFNVNLPKVTVVYKGEADVESLVYGERPTKTDIHQYLENHLVKYDYNYK